MSIAIRHPFLAEPLAPRTPRTPFMAAFVSSIRTVFGPSRPTPEPTASAQGAAQECEGRSVFHRLAASDLAFRDVAHPLFGTSIRL